MKAERLTKKKKKKDLEMKGHPCIWTNAFLTSAESSEVLSSFGSNIIVQFHHYPSFKLFPYADVQKAPSSPHLSVCDVIHCGVGWVEVECLQDLLDSSLRSLFKVQSVTNRV